MRRTNVYFQLLIHRNIKIPLFPPKKIYLCNLKTWRVATRNEIQLNFIDHNYWKVGFRPKIRTEDDLTLIIICKS